MEIDCPHCQKPVGVTLFPAFSPCPAVIFKDLNDKRNPTYLFHLHAMCNECGRYIHTVKQGPESMTQLRKQVTAWRKELQSKINH